MATVSFLGAFVDDAAVMSAGAVGVHQATAAFSSRATVAELGSLLLRDVDLPLVRGFAGPLAVVVTGGAGQVAGPAALCSRLGLHLSRIEIALRDLDDLPGNARRVVAAVDDARAAGSLDEATEVHVDVPATGSPVGWLAAADEVAAADFRLSLRAGSAHAGAPAADLLRWIDAALDRETPFSCQGLGRALRHDGADGAAHHGFLNVLVATQLLFDGLPDPGAALEERDAPALLELAGGIDLARPRRWFTSFGSEDVTLSLADIATLGLGGGAR